MAGVSVAAGVVATDLTAPGPIGATTPSTGAFTTVTTTSTIISQQPITSAVGVAPNAGGNSNSRLLIGSIAGFGIYVGSGVPTVSAAKGSLYLRTDGTGIADRMYVNTDGAATWTNLVTAA